MGDISIETKNVSTQDVLSGTNTEASDLRELKVGAGSSIFYTDKEGSRWGHTTFDSAKAWIKVDGTAKFMSSSGDVLLSTGATDGNFINIINNALNTSSKTILSDFTFESTDYAGAFKTGNITWSDTTGLVTGGTGIVINSRGIIGASSGVTKFSIDSTTGNATFAGTLAAPSGTLGTITAGTIIGATIQAGTITGATIQTATTGRRIKMSTDQVLRWLNGDSTEGYIYNDGSGNMYIDADNIMFIVADGSGDDIWLSAGDNVYATGNTLFYDFTGDMSFLCDNHVVYYNEDQDASEAKWIEGGGLKMELDDGGNLYVAGNVSADNIDFAEMFESSDGKKIPLGTTVVFDNEDKIRPAKEDEIPFGAVSGTAAIALGDGREWNKKYLRNELGEYIMEEVSFWRAKKDQEFVKENGKKYISKINQKGIVEDGQLPPKGVKTKKIKRRKINPEWNENKKFIRRSRRDEWSTVGLIGRVRILKNQPVSPNWLKIRDINDTIEEWLIR